MPKSIQQIRKQYPQYDDLSDEVLADRLYQTYYSDMPRAEFNKRVGLDVNAGNVYQTSSGQNAVSLDNSVLGSITSAMPPGMQYGAEAAAKASGDLMQSVASLPFDVAGAFGSEKAEETGQEVRQTIPEVKGGQYGTDTAGTVIQYGLPAGAGFRAGQAALGNAPSAVRYAGGLLGAAGAEGAVTDPNETSTIGDLVGYGPTQTESSDGALLRRAKTAGETIPLGAFADTLAVPFRARGQMERKLGREMNRRVERTGDDPAKVADQLQEAADAYEAPERQGFRPTTGTASDNNALLAIEQGVSSRPVMMTRFQQNRDALNRVVDEAIQTTGDPEKTQQFFLERYKGPTREAQAAQQRAEQLLDEAQNELSTTRSRVSSTGTGADADRASQQVDAVVDEELQRLTARKNHLFDQIDPNNEVAIPDPQRLFNQLNSKNAMRSRSRTDTSVKKLRSYIDEPVMRQLTRILRQRGGDGVPAKQGEVAQQLTIGEISDLRPDLSAAIRKAREANEGRVVERLVNIREALNDQVDALAERGGQAAEGAQEALRFYREEYAPRFRQGKGDRYRRDVRRDNVEESQTGKRFLLGPQEGAAQLRTIIDNAENSKAGLRGAEDFLSTQLARRLATASDKNAANVTNQFIRDYSGTLQSFPELAKRLRRVQTDLKRKTDRVSGLTEKVKQKRQEVKLTEKERDQSAAAYFLNEDPTDAVAKAMQSKNPAQTMRTLRREAARSPQALKGLKAATRDYLKRTLTPRSAEADEGVATTVGRMNQAFNNDKLQAGLRQIYSPGEIAQLNKARNRLNQMARINRRNTDNSITSQLQQTSDQQVRTVLSSLYGIVSGQGIFQIGKWLGNMARGGRTLEDIGKELLEDTMLDPQLAAMLMRGDSRATRRQLRPYLLNNYPQLFAGEATEGEGQGGAKQSN